ncbi:hypothetical protein N0V90_010827 [Kalmusia sp. IMI 367209]|nr:hypothetical protein N0V90_010827 [Kalmusia sp. IMI 367209]
MDKPTLEAFLTGFNEIKSEVQQMTSRFQGVDKQLIRVETLLLRHNDSMLSTSSSAAQGSVQGEGPSKDAQDRLDRIPDKGESGTMKDPANEDAWLSVKLDYPRLPLPTNLGNTAFADALNLHPSLQGGWGDKQAEAILGAKLVSTCYTVEVFRYLRPLEDRLATMSKQLSLIETSLKSESLPPSTEKAKLVIEPPTEATKEHASVNGPPITRRSPSKLQRIKLNPGNLYTNPTSARPVFGLPSTPTRRAASFDLNNSPFAIYRGENSPFTQLAKNSKKCGNADECKIRTLVKQLE